MEENRMDPDEQQRRGLQEYIFDLEEIKERAEELSFAHEKLKGAQDLLVSVLSCTAHGLCLLKGRNIAWCNNALAEISGWEHHELMGANYRVLCPSAPEHVESNRAIDLAVNQGGPVGGECCLAHKSGRTIPCIVIGRALDTDDPSKGYVVSVTDFSERHRSEEALKKAYDELERRSSELIRTNEKLNLEIEERKRAEEKLQSYREQLEEQVKARTVQLRQEIEERRHAQEELKKANDYLESILANSPDAIGIVDRHGNFVKWSRRIAPFFGWDQEKFGEQKAFDLYANEAERDRMLDLLRRDGFVNEHEILMKKRDGSTFPVEISISLLRDIENRTIGSVAIARDLGPMKKMLNVLEKTNRELRNQIAIRREAEDALRESENEYRAIFENTGTAAVIIEQDTTISLANAEFEKLSGFSRAEIEGAKKWTEFVSPDDLTTMLDYHNLRRIDPSSAPRQYEFRFRDKSGGIKNVFLTIASIPDSGRTVASLLDVTIQKAMEAEALKAHKLESVGILAGGIAHDFNNILTAIVGNVTLAKMSLKPADKIFQRLEETEKACFRAKDLTQQLLTFSRGGKPVTKIMPIAELIRDSSTFALRGSNVKPEIAIADSLWPVDIDEGQISQVISNLILNADQAMPSGGIVRVEAENISLGSSSTLPMPPGPYVRVSVRDQGTGIAEEHLGKVFDPYFSTKQKGSGLGLATVYSIINRHGGHIAVESELRVGSTFSFYLPFSGEPATAVPQPAQELLPGNGKILIMDDDELILEMLGEMMACLGYEAGFARDGAEAMRMYLDAKETGQAYDMVIMDLTIPGGMGGKETIERLRAIDPEITAIVSSGYSNDPIMADYREFGFSGVISKPYKMEELTGTLHRLIPRSRTAHAG